MQTFLFLFLIFAAFHAAGQSLGDTPQQALNHYVSFLNQSADEVDDRFRRVQAYYSTIDHSGNGRNLPQISPSRTLEEYYYKKAIASQSLTEAEKKRLDDSAKGLWKLLNKIDQTVKSLEIYDRLQDYKQDNFKKANVLIADLKGQIDQFSRDKTEFYKQIQRVYHRYQPYRANDPYLYSEKEMNDVLESQLELLDTLRYYLNDSKNPNWPVELIQKSILADEKLLADFGQAQKHIEYPASDMIGSFRAGLQSIQTLKKHAVDDFNFAARQSARHNNEFYKSFINYYNNDLLSWYQQFVKYSTSTRRLLDFPKFSPVFAVDVSESIATTRQRAQPFRDVPRVAFTIKPATSPANPALFQTLNAYVDFINESLRQMNTLQLEVRNYQYSVDSYRTRSGRRAPLTYAHEGFKVPVSEHQTLTIRNPQILPTYRASVSSQADVLLAMLKEMDALSVELIDYTNEKRYEQDNFQRSDEIMDRYVYLFDTFDQKKEQLYSDVRRIFESYPAAKPSDSWNVSGKALLRAVDMNKEILFGVRAYLKKETNQLPQPDSLQLEARSLIINEFKNLKGLQRLGRNNGLCPYSPYEDIAENSLKWSDMLARIARTKENSYESCYYFFNNELAYEYNKFADLAKVNLLKTINEPNIFAFRRSKTVTLPPEQAILSKADTKPVAVQTSPSVEPNKVPDKAPTSSPVSSTANGKSLVQHDTVYINRATVDTVYIDRSGPVSVPTSLNGFAANNMILLLDVSGSMDSPVKLPLLKKSVKSLLRLLRPEDQLAIVVYSGKAKVVLKPTSGSNTDEIIRVIDQLQSDGDTDGNEGIKLAYKVANKNYLRAGNNRIILATDGEFPISDDTFSLVAENSNQDVYITVFTYGKNEIKSNTLKKLAQTGKGTYTHVTPENADLKLITYHSSLIIHLRAENLIKRIAHR
ncbi:VWA domain-containing protein, partial [Spirosoma sp. BT702]